MHAQDHSEVAHYIPEHRFRFITLAIIIPALVIGILTPSIELIIGLVGSTIGVAICIMFPATCFIKLGKRDSSELLLAKFLLVFGFFLMVLGTYANLEAFEDRTTGLQPPVLGEHLHNPIDADVMPVVVPALTATIRGPSIEADRMVVPTALAARSDVIEPVAPLEIGIVSKVVVAPLSGQSPEPDPNVGEPIAIDRKLVDSANPPLEPEINHDAIAHEEHEIAIEAKQKNDELKETKELVQEIKLELAKQNEKTQKMVMEKFEQIVDKVEHIEKIQEEAAAKSQSLKNNDDQTKAVSQLPAFKVNSSLDTSSPTNKPIPPRKVIETDDPIINMIQKTAKSKIETRSIANDRISDTVPTATASPPMADAIASIVNVNKVSPADQISISTAEPNERVARDLLGLSSSSD